MNTISVRSVRKSNHTPFLPDPLFLFAAEGALLQFITSFNGFGNNLFATALGATDSQIGLIQTIPNAAAVLLLLPLGLLADRLRSSRTIPLVSLFCIAAGFFLMAFVPALGQYRMPFFFLGLIFTVGGPVLYNAQWQNFFGDVVQPDSRNRVLTQRNRYMFAVGIFTPLLCSIIMNRYSGNADSFRAFRLFFLLCGGIMLAQALVVSCIAVPVRPAGVPGNSAGLLSAWHTLFRSRTFLLFFLPVTFFYMTWQMDWSMWYIGQVQYLKLTDAQITAYNGFFNIGQLAAIGILSRQVRRVGSDRVLPWAGLGLMFCPLIMIVCTRVPQPLRMNVFTVLVTLLNAPQCAVNLCVVQILLNAAPKRCRNMAISLYTLTITLSNCFMPYLGVRLYAGLGGDYAALLQFNGILTVLRLGTLLLLLFRCRSAAKNEQKTSAVSRSC